MVFSVPIFSYLWVLFDSGSFRFAYLVLFYAISFFFSCYNILYYIQFNLLIYLGSLHPLPINLEFSFGVLWYR